jgi:riboflavin synthase
MFTGLIEEVGNVVGIQEGDRARQLSIAAPLVSSKIQVGDSVAVNGCCLTVVNNRDGRFTCDLLQETLDRTNLKSLCEGSRVNLERALAIDGRLGGHFVQGHVDCTAHIIAMEGIDGNDRLEVELPAEFAHYVASKGSISVNGISLTIAEVSTRSFAVWIIPHTKSQTNLATIGTNELVNLEFDLIAKYLERMFDRHVVPS